MKLFNFLRRDKKSSTSETHTIQSEVVEVIDSNPNENPTQSEVAKVTDSNPEFANLLAFLVKSGRMKEYKNIYKFFKDQEIGYESVIDSDAEALLADMSILNKTEEITKFIQQFKLLRCKCDDERFMKFVCEY